MGVAEAEGVERGEAGIADTVLDFAAAGPVLGPGPPGWVLPAQPARPGFPVAAEEASRLRLRRKERRSTRGMMTRLG